MIKYSSQLKDIENTELKGFFVGWPDPPNTETFKKLLNQSYKVIIAIDDNKVIGFITAISDGVLSSYIPFLEVLPEYQSRSIGKELLSMMKLELKDLYMIDLLCDKELVPYYEKQGMSKTTGAFIRNYYRQSGV